MDRRQFMKALSGGVAALAVSDRVVSAADEKHDARKAMPESEKDSWPPPVPMIIASDGKATLTASIPYHRHKPHMRSTAKKS